MKKIGNRELILIIGILLVIILVLIIVFKITGFAVIETREVSVFRLIDGNNVKLSIVSSENVLAIQENFSSPECKVISYDIKPEIEIFVFKDSENTWISANRSDNLIAELSYNFGLKNESADIDCSVVSGKYFVISGEGLGEGYFEGEEENETQETPAPSVPAGGGGADGGGGGAGGGGGGGISAAKPEMLSDDIVDVKDEEELEGAVESAIRKISGEETPGQIKKGPILLTGILILIVISIIIFLVVSFSRKPHK